MKKILASLAVAAILAPAALADGGAHAPSAASTRTAAAACKAVVKDPATWSAFAAKVGIVGKVDFAAAFGKNPKNGKTPLGACVSFVAKQIAAARKAGTTTTTTTTATPSVEDACKAELAKPGTPYRNLGDCVKEKSGK